MQVKVRTLYDPYKQRTLANVEDLLALFEDVKAHPENYDEATVKRLAAEVLGKMPASNKPF
jgi:hypothetical protein